MVNRKDLFEIIAINVLFKVEAVRVDPFNNGSCRGNDPLDEDGDKYTMQVGKDVLKNLLFVEL